MLIFSIKQKYFRKNILKNIGVIIVLKYSSIQPIIAHTLVRARSEQEGAHGNALKIPKFLYPFISFIHIKNIEHFHP